MNDTVTSIQNVFSKNRAEELGSDVWRHFVVPPFYHRLDVTGATKPRVIIGGRGCGKTMLLRYWSHQSMFSRSRVDFSESETNEIGLYWRADTQFASAMAERDVPTDIWQAGFSHMVALIIGMEVLDSLHSVAESKSPLISSADVEAAQLSRLRAFDPSLPETVAGLRDALEEHLWMFESWVNDVRKRPQPDFLPGQQFILALIKQVQKEIPALKNITFFVYVDEYENLRGYQQNVINTWLKHSEPPLIFNLAMKRNSEQDDTVGSEHLADIHDKRRHDLERYFVEEGSELFFAEILFLRLANAGFGGPPVSIADLHDPSKLIERKGEAYKKQILTTIEKIFPDVSHEDLAMGVFQDDSLSRKLQARIKDALDKRGARLPVEKFFRPALPEATIITPVLLNRRRNKPEDVAKEMDKLEIGEANHFTGRRDWTQNNFIGSLLQLYEPYDRACPFYAGFHTFLKLSRGNIRHFLELCHKSIYRAFPDGGFEGQEIPPSQQAEAARQASTAFLGEVPSFGKYGNKLHFFVLALGSLFSLAHLRPSLSESEQSHFSVVRGSEPLSDIDEEFLSEATKWSVLFEEEATKIKQSYQPETTEYILNPIYAPYFHISYRKKRKLELKSEELIRLIRGSYEDVSALLRRYTKDWAIEPASMHPTLFSHLTEDMDENSDAGR
jgi:hypothetical protein